MVELNPAETSSQITQKPNMNSLAWQFIKGVHYLLSRNTILYLSFRILILFTATSTS